MDINIWLDNFKESWKNHNVEKVLDLFDKNVEYFETPFLKLENFEKLAKEWEGIKTQKNIELNFEIFSSFENKHSVIWKLKYLNLENKEINCAGTYLIELNEEGKCIYFHHSCEVKN